MSKSTLTFISKFQNFKKLNCWNELNCGTQICRATPGKKSTRRSRDCGLIGTWTHKKRQNSRPGCCSGKLVTSATNRPWRQLTLVTSRQSITLAGRRKDAVSFSWAAFFKSLLMLNGTTSRLFFWILGRCFNDFPKFMSGCFDSQRPVMPCHRMNVVQYNVDSQYKMSCSVQFWSYF